MKVLKLKFLMDVQQLIKNIKIFLNIRNDIPIILFYHYNEKNRDLIVNNRELFMSIYHYNHLNNEFDNNMKLKLIVKYDIDNSSIEKIVNIIFENKVNRLEDFKFGL